MVTPDSALTRLWLCLVLLRSLRRLGIFLLRGCAKDTNWSPLQVQRDMMELQGQECQGCRSPSESWLETEGPEGQRGQARSPSCIGQSQNPCTARCQSTARGDSGHTEVYEASQIDRNSLSWAEWWLPKTRSHLDLEP